MTLAKRGTGKRRRRFKRTPHFYFDFSRDDGPPEADSVGEELPTVQVAKKEAMRALGDLARDFSRRASEAARRASRQLRAGFCGEIIRDGAKPWRSVPPRSGGPRRLRASFAFSRSAILIKRSASARSTSARLTSCAAAARSSLMRSSRNS
ncbi:DUF6894 family protein [Bradyrhizobium japonicum]|uniref:DUF6894 family protein n=1 Tax=Bradyrhizobium japonicum TaxID=375 RepID=UPI003D9C4505